MPRGGARPGSGPKKGTKYRERFQLTAVTGEQNSKLTPSKRMAALKRQVILCAHDGMSEADIAVVMNTTIENLRAVFGRELEHGAVLKRAEELVRLDAASAGGSVPASKTFLAGGSGNKKDAATSGAANPKETSDDKVTRLALRVLNGGAQ